MYRASIPFQKEQQGKKGGAAFLAISSRLSEDASFALLFRSSRGGKKKLEGKKKDGAQIPVRPASTPS